MIVLPVQPEPRPPFRRFLIVALVAVILAHLGDGWVYRQIALPRFGNNDFGRMLRIQGYLPTWIFVAAALVMTDWPRRATEGLRAVLHRGALLLGSATVGGAVAEVAKVLIRRERPRAGDGAYLFRDWSDRPFVTSSLGMPSSHVLVAFAALAMLVRFFPRARPVWYALAVGCAFTRVAAGAHFLSDVTVAAVLGIAIAELLWRRFPPPVTP